MKIWQIILLSFIIISCDNELELIEDYKDIPVVYGILVKSDSAQYIRVEKAFVDESTSALELAQNPDSLYYENADVSIKHNNISYPLTRVDGNFEGYVREDGVFATEPNVLYKILTDDIVLNEGEEYTFSLIRNDNLPEVNSIITLIETPLLIAPNSSVSSLDFDYVQPNRYRWTKNETNFLFDLALKIKWRERDITSGLDFEDRTITWIMKENTTGKAAGPEGNLLEETVSGFEFYAFLVNHLEEDPNIVRRNLRMDFILTAAAEEIERYVTTSTSNVGITSSQDVPVYSNLSEGRGIFSSSTRTRIDDLTPTSGTLDSLVNGQLTKGLNFQF